MESADAIALASPHLPTAQRFLSKLYEEEARKDAYGDEAKLLLSFVYDSQIREVCANP